MKSFTILLALFVATSYGKSVDLLLPELNSAYGYMTKYGIPRAEERLKAEKEFLAKQDAARIINGSPASEGQYPWQVGLFTNIIGIDDGRRGVCGGSLVSKKCVATAAHCWFDGMNQAWKASVTLGSTMLNNHLAVIVESTKVAVHPEWMPYLVRNDVAMIYLPYDIQFSNNISPVALPSGPELTETFVGETAIVSGFGLTSNNGAIAADQFLSHVEVPIISNTVCRASGLAFLLFVHDTNICSSGAGGNGPCQGDSGGPLVIKRNGKHIMVGVVSFGSANGCHTTEPAAYARTTSFIDFFNDHM